MFETIQELWRTITSWILETPSTPVPGTCTSTIVEDVKKPLPKQKVPNGRPPLVPKRRRVLFFGAVKTHEI